MGPEQNGGSGHTLAPDDFATIYDITPLYQAGIDGTGQTIAIVGAARVDLLDMQRFRNLYNLPGQDPIVTLVPYLPDPGSPRAELIEAALDLEWSQAVARNATIQYVYSEDPFDAVEYVVDQNLATVVSTSFGYGCEAQNPDELIWLQSLAQQAVIEGITWVNAAGDAGPADCDGNGAPIAQGGKSVDLPASVPEIVAVGGTQFNDSGGGYWAPVNGANSASALSYIPEQVWNQSAQRSAIWAGAGGVSIYYPKPGWQSGPGVPNDGYRDVPDVSFAGSVYDGYNVISGGRSYVVGGTSAGSPAFAGVVALLSQYLQTKGAISNPGLGNINPGLYASAAMNPGAFHDVVSGDNMVPCVTGSPDCRNGSFGYSAGAGYDFGSGLGSPDVNNLISGWRSWVTPGSQISLSVDANPVYQRPTGVQENQWAAHLTVTEEGGVPSTITDFQIEGVSYAQQITALFGSAALPAFGSLKADVSAKTLVIPRTRVFTVGGTDASGNKWTRSIPVQFLGPPPNPTVKGAANGASFAQAFAPGMVMSIFGSDLAAGTQVAGAVPLIYWMSGTWATIDDVPAPLYFVSPNQINLQIPYFTHQGSANLTINNGRFSGSYVFQVSSTAPGIFTDQKGAPVPNGSGAPGQTLTLFITGDGQISPTLATGHSPSGLGPLPAPVQPVSMTIGGAPADTPFVGIPPGLVGVTQINFTVPAVPAGPQPLVVTVGSVASAPATFTVTPCSASCIQ